MMRIPALVLIMSVCSSVCLLLISLFAVGGGQAEVAVTGPDSVEVHAGGEAILQVGKSQANVRVLKTTDPDIGVKLDQNEEDGGGQMEASANATILKNDHSQMKNDTGDQMGDVEGRQLVNLANETKSNDLENEETTILVSSTTIASEVELKYTEQNLDGALNRTQDSDHIQATSSTPLVVLEVNPSAETSGEKNPKEVVSKRKPFVEEALEESKSEESTNLSDEQVVVVSIIAVVIVAIIVIAIVKIKKLLCFSEIEGDGEDAEKSTLQMYSIEKATKSSYDQVKEGINP